jgi:hypothetical protein
MGAYRRAWLRTDQSASRSHHRVGDRRSVLELDGRAKPKASSKSGPRPWPTTSRSFDAAITTRFQLGVIRLLAFEDVLGALGVALASAADRAGQLVIVELKVQELLANAPEPSAYGGPRPSQCFGLDK